MLGCKMCLQVTTLKNKIFFENEIIISDNFTLILK